MKRSVSPINRPFQKQKTSPSRLKASLDRPISPPPLKRKRRDSSNQTNTTIPQSQSLKSSAVEAGEVNIDDHLTFFSMKLQEHCRPDNIIPSTPRISHSEWVDLYKRNQHPHGRHFVIHQHDHPVAGTHYDLRLQISETSSISWAIMYGLPGDANSRRLNRNATETRVHCLWNHLIETASHSTGSMTIWDTGEYTIVPRQDPNSEPETSNSDSEPDASEDPSPLSETEKLQHAFKKHKIRLRLHGTRLPHGYTLYIRLTHDNDITPRPTKPTRRRRKRPPAAQQPPDSASESSYVAPTTTSTSSNIPASHSDSEDNATHLTNAYPGATNIVGAIHQRKWYLSMDRLNSGFVPEKDPRTKKTIWVRRKKKKNGEKGDGDGEEASGFDPFYVRGREVERSVVTGRLAADVLKDEGVTGFVPRGMWRAVVE